jgi:uncharacterized membrane protein YgdD (TMEM256/DUF423 family)
MGPRVLVAVAGLFGALGVGLGAFGAHAWREKLPAERLAHVDTAVHYLFVAIPGLLVIGVFAMECSGGDGVQRRAAEPYRLWASSRARWCSSITFAARCEGISS